MVTGAGVPDSGYLLLCLWGEEHLGLPPAKVDTANTLDKPFLGSDNRAVILWQIVILRIAATMVVLQ